MERKILINTGERMKEMKRILILILLILSIEYLYANDTKDGDFSFKTTLSYNSYGPNYQGYGPALGKKFIIKKGNKIRVEISGIANKDIPIMYFSIVDRSQNVEFWKDITPKKQLVIKDIVAGEPFKCSFTTNALATPTSYSSARFVFMHEYMQLKKVKLSNCEINIQIEK